MPISTTDKKANRLIKESSPYLLQHAYNPVDWYPWGEEAFARAEKEDKPIFLSIGYSTCHWCHVMERESFEDEEVAQLLNEAFVAVKVDREERPDIDHIYMNACQALTGQGGWPLTVFLTPDRKPFFAGTYYPKHSAFGRIGLIDLLQKVASAWKDKREDLLDSANQLSNISDRASRTKENEQAGEETLTAAYKHFSSSFDERHGGFGAAPKFPSPHNLIYLLRYGLLFGETKATFMAEKTLRSMAKGGIFDQVGFGFSRYSTDRKWLVPHFEKMLYDNALLAIAYLEAYQVTGDLLMARVAEEVFTYVLRDMTSPRGGFFTAEDADSEGEEGLFYLWTPQEAAAVLGPAEAEQYCSAFDITARGNFEGRSIPNLINQEDAALMQIKERFAPAGAALYAAREKRIRPFRDEKILPSWNGLMIAALAMGGRVLKNPAYLQAAALAARVNLNRELHFLEDYAFLSWGLLELHQSSQDPLFLAQCLDLTGKMLELFWDDEQEAFYMTPAGKKDLISRPLEFFDGAVPSGNSVAALNLARLALLTGNEELSQKATQLHKSFAPYVKDYAAGYAFFLLSLLFSRASREVVIVGNRDGNDTGALLDVCYRDYRPDTLIILSDPNDNALRQLIPRIGSYSMAEGKATAYVCRDFACRAPVTTPESLAALLAEG